MRVCETVEYIVPCDCVNEKKAYELTPDALVRTIYELSSEPTVS